MRSFIVRVSAETTSKKLERASYRVTTGGGPVEAKRIAIGEFMAYELSHRNRYMRLKDVTIREVKDDDA